MNTKRYMRPERKGISTSSGERSAYVRKEHIDGPVMNTKNGLRGRRNSG